MLDTLRKKKEHTRMIIAGVTALVITSAVVAFWIWSSSGRFSSARQVTENTQTKPLQVLSNSVKEIFSGYEQDRQKEVVVKEGEQEIVTQDETVTAPKDTQDTTYDFEATFSETETQVIIDGSSDTSVTPVSENVASDVSSTE